MKTSNTWNFRPLVGKIMLGLVLAGLIGSINVAPALARDRDRGRHDHGRYENRGRGYYDYDRHGRRYYRSYGYRERVYVQPPPVIYAPPPPAGIGIFLPPLYLQF